MDPNIERLGHSVTSNSFAKLSAVLFTSLAVVPHAQATGDIGQQIAQHFRTRSYYSGAASSQTETSRGWELQKVGIDDAIAEIAKVFSSRQTRLGEAIEAVLSAYRSELYA